MFEKLIQKVLNLHEEDVYQGILFTGVDVKNEKSETLDWSEYLEIPINDIEVDIIDGDTMICDGILYWGDGTIEFHDRDGFDAYNWRDFSNDSINKIMEVLENEIKTA